MNDDSETDERGIDRRTVLRSAVAASATGLVGVPAFAGSAGATTETTTTEIPLTWERSAETSDGVAKSNELEGAVSDGLMLSTSPDGSVTGTSGGTVWNGDQYYQGNDGQYLEDVDFEFATWDQWDAGCASSDSSPYDGSNNDGEPYQVRLFEANFDLPDGVSPENVTGVALTSPVDVSGEDIIPINDNFYVALNGSGVLQKGGTADPSFGLSDFGPASRNQDYDSYPGLVVSDGWYFSGDLGTGTQDYLEAEDNTLYFAVEEFCNWGGMTRLDLSITYEACTECTTDGLLAKYEFSCVEYDDDECVEYDFVLEEGDESLVGYSDDSYTSKDGEEFEPVTATFDTDLCTVYAVVKAGTEIEVQEAAASDGTVTVENVDPYAISFVEFYCDEEDAEDAADAFPGGSSGEGAPGEDSSSGGRSGGDAGGGPPGR